MRSCEVIFIPRFFIFVTKGLIVIYYNTIKKQGVDLAFLITERMLRNDMTDGFLKQKLHQSYLMAHR